MTLRLLFSSLPMTALITPLSSPHFHLNLMNLFHRDLDTCLPGGGAGGEAGAKPRNAGE